MKRALSLLVALVMILTMLPAQAFAATTATLTVSGSGFGSNYNNKYIVISDGTDAGLYYVNRSGKVENTDGTEATFGTGNYTVYYGMFSGWSASFANGSFTVEESTTSATVTLRGTNVSVSADYDIRRLYATSSYYNTTSFNHVDLRVAAAYEIKVGNQRYTASVYNPSVVVRVDGREVARNSWDGSTSYEWRRDGLTLTRSGLIEVELTLDLRYTDSRGQEQLLEDVQILYDNVHDVDKFIDAIAICDMLWGLDFRVSVQDLEEEIQYYAVSYEWKVYNTDGTYTNLPANAPNPPAATGGHEYGQQYVYDTEYFTGTSFYDYDAGLLYTFHGWDTYSHSAVYNPIPSTGYYALDDGDADSANNKTVEITADTYIYGYWTVTELEPSSAHIAIEKVFVVDGREVSLAEAEALWFRVDTGIDRDGDGDTTVDVDYNMIRGGNGEYKIPVYQYEIPFVFTEHNADVPGYTRTTTITVSGGYIRSSVTSGDSVTVTMEPVYTGENVHLGTVTYTNTYTRNVGQAVSEYPVLTLLKTASDTGLAQSGVVFTLYRDPNCTQAVTTVTTGEGGVITLDFAAIANVEPGTYYLKETGPLAGYYADPYVYAITLTPAQPVEELRGGEFVEVTYHTLTVEVPENSSAVFSRDSARLHIFNDPILGSLGLSKVISGMAEADKSKLSAVVIVHGPIRRDNGGAITDIGSTWQLNLNSENNWSASLADLPLGEYLIHESFASVHGYTWTGVTYGDLETVVYNGITSGVFAVTDDTAITLTLTNTYEEWTAADFYIKKVNEGGIALPGAVFLLSSDVEGNDVVATVTTGADGYAHFDGFTVPEGRESVTYYLREVQAPAGYYLSDQVYQVVITAVTEGGRTTYEPSISLLRGRSNGFDIDTDLLTVTNYPVLGSLTVIKAFANGFVPEGLTSVSVLVGGPNGFSRRVELNSGNQWSVTLTDLPLGQYTVTELDANVPGYTWEVSYSSQTVTLTEAEPGKTVYGDPISHAVTVTNTYTRNEELFEVPTAITVLKVGEDGRALSGAVFTLERLSADGKSVLRTVSFTTGADGTVVFDLLTGFILEGEAVAGTYILSETQAPAGYQKTDDTWIITIREDDDGQIRWELNENKNVFEGFWDWIVGEVDSGTFENGVLTVTNARKLGSLTVTKAVVDPKGLYADASYSFTLDCSDDSFDRTFTLKAGQSLTVDNIPWGVTYTLTEDTTGAAFTGVITDDGNGRIWADTTQILVTNTYAYTTHTGPLFLVKVDADDNAKVISGAGFTLFADREMKNKIGEEVLSDDAGNVALNVPGPGTYYLAETTTPAGYHANPLVYVVTAEEKTVVKHGGTADAVTEIQLHIRIEGLTGTTENQIDYIYAIENTAIKTLAVSVEKVWEDGGYYDRPESVDVTLYRDGEAFDTVELSRENQWSYTWEGLTDEYDWTVDESSVPAGYTKTVTAEGNHFTVTNTRQTGVLDVRVEKIWFGAGVEHPASVRVTLYRNGEAYDTVTLSKANGWRYVWEGLSDVYQWTVDEPSVPSGYNKTVRRNGNSFTITNTHEDNPYTGDLADLSGKTVLTAMSAAGFGISAWLMLMPRKKEEEE